MKTAFIATLVALIATNSIVQARLSVPTSSLTKQVDHRFLAEEEVKADKKWLKKLAIQSLESKVSEKDIFNHLGLKSFGTFGIFSRISHEQFLENVGGA
jgi:hypothetical protein